MAIAENMGALNAALAANKNGSNALLALVKYHEKETVQKYLELLRNYASTKMLEPIRRFPDGIYSATEYLDDGLLLNEPIPLNDGLLEPVTFILPTALLNPDFDDDPKKCPAVLVEM